jgi:hypothetical protein
MKTMTCKQLGGACNEAFSANSFEDIAKLSQEHGMAMFAKKEQSHIDAMNKMQKMMAKPDKMAEWFDNKKQEFEALPND